MKNLRWQQRFQNFENAFLLLQSTFREKTLTEFSDLEKEGIIQRFEYTFELAWKTVKDYLEYSGIALEQITPRHVIKQAFAANIIEDGAIWITMLEHRNLLSHRYDKNTFEIAVAAIEKTYLAVLEKMYQFLKEKDSQI